MSHPSDADQDFIAAAMPAFISEAGEQTEAIETLLLELEEQPDNRELLDSLFRCAHTVKGSAGIFGLNKVVEFTHHVETLLDQCRDGKLALTPELSTLLLQCNDQIRFLVDSASDELQDTPAQKELRADLVLQLRAYTEAQAGVAPTVPHAAAAASVNAPVAADPSAPTLWQIAARFGPETFRNGMDPLSIAKYLQGLGTVKSVRAPLMRCRRWSTSTPRPATWVLPWHWSPAPAATTSRVHSASLPTIASSTCAPRTAPSSNWCKPLRPCRRRRVWVTCWWRSARSARASSPRCYLIKSMKSSNHLGRRPK